MPRYKFMLRPVNSFHVPSGVTIDFSTKQAEPDTPHGSAELSRELTADEVRRFDLYPVDREAGL